MSERGAGAAGDTLAAPAAADKLGAARGGVAGHEEPDDGKPSFSSENSVYGDYGLGTYEDLAALDAEDLPARSDGTISGFVRWAGGLLLVGMGLFMEAFILVTTGQVKTVWADLFPVCWAGGTSVNCPAKVQCPGAFSNGSPAPGNPFCTGPGGTYPSSLTCSGVTKRSISYVEFAGIMFGMLCYGYLADLVGRRTASLFSASCMIVGVTIMAFVYSPSVESIFAVFSTFYFVFGAGVGGEYPIAAASAAERRHRQVELETSGEGGDALYYSETVLRSQRVASERAKAKRRGEAISIVFSMQGIGAVSGSIVLIVALAIAQQNTPDCSIASNNEQGYSPIALRWVWHFFYFFGLMLLVFVLLFRLCVARENDTFARARERRQRRKERFAQEGRQVRNKYVCLFRHYWSRLLATGGTWFVFDFQFYGNKLFSGPIFSAILSQPSLLKTNEYVLLNNSVALVGYYLSTLVIDRKWCGRVRLQMWGFFAMFALFLAAGIKFDYLQANNAHALLALYILTSFFSQWGPNVTTYVCSAELYPAEARATAHGMSAFSGKAGALIATIVFGYVTTRIIFFISAAVCIVGALLTLVFLPDATDLSLQEHDVEYELLQQGRVTEYGGEAVNPKHLSLFERWIGRGAQYEPSWIVGFRQREMESNKKDISDEM